MIREYVYIVLLAIGVALAAAGGARFGQSDFEYTSLAGQAILQNAAEEAGGTIVSPEQRLVEWASEGLGLFVIGIGFIGFGAVMTRRRHTMERNGMAEDESAFHFEDEVRRVADEVRRLRELLDGASPDVAKIRDELELLQVANMDQLFANRNLLELQYGLSGFASVIGPLSGAERFMNRTWTTLVDHHLPEARSSLAQADDEMGRVIEALERLKSTGDG